MVNVFFIYFGYWFVFIYELFEYVGIFDLFVCFIYQGICCDGFFCLVNCNNYIYIMGDCYKCVVCNDIDFCEVCEVSFVNIYNKIYFFIKFKMFVRYVSVIIIGENENGCVIFIMGDCCFCVIIF